MDFGIEPNSLWLLILQNFPEFLWLLRPLAECNIVLRYFNKKIFRQVIKLTKGNLGILNILKMRIIKFFR